MAARRDASTCAVIFERAKVEQSLDEDVAAIRRTVTQNVYERISGSTPSSPWWANHRGSAPLNSAEFSHTCHSSKGARSVPPRLARGGSPAK
jgi:hypothetical protein